MRVCRGRAGGKASRRRAGLSLGTGPALAPIAAVIPAPTGVKPSPDRLIMLATGHGHVLASARAAGSERVRPGGHADRLRAVPQRPAAALFRNQSQ